MKSMLETFDDIYEVWEPAWWQKPITWLLLLVSILFMVIAGIIYIYMRKKYFNQRLTRKELLLRYLASLPISLEHEKEIYTTIMDIMHESIVERFGKKTTHLTEAELLLILKEYNQEMESMLKPVIEHAFAVRFAAHRYSLEEVTADLQLFSHSLKKFLELPIHESPI